MRSSKSNCSYLKPVWSCEFQNIRHTNDKAAIKLITKQTLYVDKIASWNFQAKFCSCFKSKNKIWEIQFIWLIAETLIVILKFCSHSASSYSYCQNKLLISLLRLQRLNKLNLLVENVSVTLILHEEDYLNQYATSHSRWVFNCYKERLMFPWTNNV